MLYIGSNAVTKYNQCDRRKSCALKMLELSLVPVLIFSSLLPQYYLCRRHNTGRCALTSWKERPRAQFSKMLHFKKVSTNCDLTHVLLRNSDKQRNLMKIASRSSSIFWTFLASWPISNPQHFARIRRPLRTRHRSLNYQRKRTSTFKIQFETWKWVSKLKSRSLKVLNNIINETSHQCVRTSKSTNSQIHFGAIINRQFQNHDCWFFQCTC